MSATPTSTRPQSDHALHEAYAGAATAVARILGGATLNRALIGAAGARGGVSLRAATADFTYNTTRAFGIPQALTTALLNRPVTDTVLIALLYVTLVDLRDHRARAHAIVDQAVHAADTLGRGVAKGLVNAVLRNFLRRADELEAKLAADPVSRYRYPRWWIDRLRRAYPDGWEQILGVANEPPLLTLRVNVRRTSVDIYLERLAQAGLGARRLGASAVSLDRPVPVERIPGFERGDVSVQDAGAQMAVPLLDLAPGQRVLDACAAPGGKTGHILEAADVAVTALDSDAERAARVGENLARLGLFARVITGDAASPESWWDGQLFDRVLADVPCTASGVVRRHPDIKWLRRPSDLRNFSQAQRPIIDALWRLLRPGGRLLYATCSVFPEENGEQVAAFIARHDDAFLVPMPKLADGQLLPRADNDGFYYAAILKRAAP